MGVTLKLMPILLAVGLTWCPSIGAGQCFKGDQLETGSAFRVTAGADEYNRLMDYTSSPTAEGAADVLSAIRALDSLLHDLSSQDHVVVFLAVGRINRIVLLNRVQRRFMGMKTDYYVDPNTVRMRTDVVHVLWITDNFEEFSTSIEVDVSRLTSDLRLATLESPPFVRPPQAKANETRRLQVGVQHIRLPYQPASFTVRFVRRDAYTFEALEWSRTYQVNQPLKSLIGISMYVGAMIPFTGTEMTRYGIESNRIVNRDVDPAIFFTLSFSLGSDEWRERFGKVGRCFIPDYFFGLGLPASLVDGHLNSYLVGLSWSPGNELIRLSLAYQFPGGDILQAEYRVGDSVPEGVDPITRDEDRLMIGINVSLAFISNLI